MKDILCNSFDLIHICTMTANQLSRSRGSCGANEAVINCLTDSNNCYSISNLQNSLMAGIVIMIK